MIKGLEGGDPSIDKDNNKNNGKSPNDVSVDLSANHSIEQSHEVLLKKQQTPRADDLRKDAQVSYGFKIDEQKDANRMNIRSSSG